MELFHPHERHIEDGHLEGDSRQSSVTTAHKHDEDVREGNYGYYPKDTRECQALEFETCSKVRGSLHGTQGGAHYALMRWKVVHGPSSVSHRYDSVNRPSCTLTRHMTG